jgi:hypothetical protein
MPSIKSTFSPDYERYEGVRPINIYLLRLLFLLVVLFVASDSWSGIFQASRTMGSSESRRGMHVGGVLGTVGFRVDQSPQMVADRDVRDLLQDHLARRRGIPALVNQSAGRFAGRRDDVCIRMGHSADRGDAVVVCSQDVHLAVEEGWMIGR